MGRKRKLATPENGLVPKLLPPCRVCDGPAGGFHYGVNTCEACKGFFHRSLKGCINYVCDKDDKCVVNFHIPKMCKKCRYAKCIAAGMAKQAIKTGRYTVEKRTQDTLEMMTAGYAPFAVKVEPEEEPTAKSGRITSCDVPYTATSCLYDRNNVYYSSDGDSQVTSPETPYDTLSESLRPVIDAFSVVHNNVGGGCSDTSSSSMCQSPPSHPFSTPTTSGFYSIPETPHTRSSISSPPSTTFTASQKPGYSPGSSSNYYPSPSDMSSTLSPPMSFANHSVPQDVSISSSYPFPEPSPEIRSESINSFRNGNGSYAETRKLPFSSMPVADICPEPEISLFSHQNHPSGPSMSLTYKYSHIGSPQGVQSPDTTTQFSEQGPSPKGSVSHSTFTQLKPASSSKVDTLDDSAAGCQDQAPSTTDCKTCGDWDCSEVDEHILELYDDTEEVVRVLSEAKYEHMERQLPHLDRTELKKKAAEYAETCRLRREMFGAMVRLPDNEYDQIYASTGLDADGRLDRLGTMTAHMEKNIRAQAKFAKCIPGFATLSLANQINLIKYSRSEILHISSYHRVVPEMGIIHSQDGRMHSLDYLDVRSNLMDEGALQDYTSLCRQLQDLNLTRGEVAVLMAAVIMAPDRTRPVLCHKARLIYEELNKVLIHLLMKRFDQPLQMFAQIINLMVRFRSFSHLNLKMLKKLRLDKYTNAMQNPLLREMIGWLYGDEGADEAVENEEENSSHLASPSNF